MYCRNCGNNNEEGSKTCVNCGALIEEVKEMPVAQTQTEVVNKVETSSVNVGTKKNNKTIIIIIISVVAGIALLGLAIVLIYKNFFLSNPSLPSNNGSWDKWEIGYKIPEEFTPSAANDIKGNTLKSYSYDDNESLCSLYINKITYLESGKTEESIMRKESSLSNSDTVNIKNIKINGKNWKYIEDKGYWSVYEYGRFSSDKSSFYSIKYKDYNPDKGVCKKYLDEILKSITYNK